MKTPTLLPSFLGTLGLAVLIACSGQRAGAERIYSDSFENVNGDQDPLGWGVAGHPSYLRTRLESEQSWTTPYGERALQTYSSGIATKDLGLIPTAAGEYVVRVNISSERTIGEYRIVLQTQEEVFDSLGPPVVVASAADDTDGSKDMSFTEELRWRYDPPEEAGFPKRLVLRLMQDPDRSSWRHTPVWDNLTVDFFPDVDTNGPELVSMEDDRNGGAVAPGTTVTYTLTFNEAMDASTLNVEDFGNQASAGVTIDAVTPTADDNVFLLEVTPTEEGTLRPRINQDATLTDVAGNPMDVTTSLIQDNVTIDVDGTNPILLPADIVDDRQGQPVAPNIAVIYTLSFTKDMNATTVSSDDFENRGSAAIIIGSITETSPTSGEFNVTITPGTGGTLQLAIKSGANLLDVDGGQLDTGTAIVDDTIIAVDDVPPTLVPQVVDFMIVGDSMVDDVNGGPVDVNTPIIYDVFFSEAMDASTLDASDFGNAGDADLAIQSVSEASPGVFRVELTPTSGGTLQLQVEPGALLQDTAGNPMDTLSAIVDPTVITVQGDNSSPFATWSGGLAFEGDDNADGINDGLAWLLGATGPDAGAHSLLPQPTTEAGGLVLSFHCLKPAERGEAVLTVQSSETLGGWAGSGAEVPAVDSTVNGIVFDVTDEGDLMHVRATLPTPVGGRMFARIVGELPAN